MSSKNSIEKRPFGKRDQIGYLFGSLANDFTFLFATSYLLIFYTKVLGIGAGYVGTLFLLARGFDAFTDVTMGTICDNSKPTKLGKFMPWIKRFSIPVVIASILMYNYFIADLSMPIKMAYATVTYLLWGSICYTGVNIPYGSMASVITGDSAQRASLSSYRSIGSIVSGLGIGMITPQLIFVTDEAGNQIASGERFFMVAIIFGVCALIAYAVFNKCCIERVELPVVEKTKDNSIKEDLKFLFRDKAFISIIAVTLLTLLAAQVSMALNQYLFLDYFGNAGLVSLALLVQTIGMFAIAPFAGKITSKFGKKEAGAVALGIVALFYVIIFILRVKNPMVYLGLQFALNIANGYFTLISWAYLTDVIDHYQVKTGKRKDGTVYAVYSFIRKLAQAFAGAIGGWTLALIGYNSVATVQTAEVKEHIFSVSIGVPTVCYIAAAILLFVVYPLTKQKIAENEAKIAQQQ